MKIKNSLKNILVIIICYLYVLLFVYAAVSKLIDFNTFQVQFGQSPLLSAFASWVSWAVVLSELLIAGLLLFDKTKNLALYLAFALMVMFTAYIIIILNFSSFVPCSCGGVLEKLGWTEHLIFNIGYIVLAAVGIILQQKQKLKKMSWSLVGILISGSLFVSVLFLLSENEIQRNNSFIRRYPPHPVTTIKGLNIKYNSYYIAGVADGRIYLGNTSAPAHLISIDTTFSDLKTHNIELNNEHKIELFAPQVKILSPHIYLIDGTSSAIFRGNLSDFKTELYWKGNNNNILISQIEVISPTKFIFRGIDQINNQNIIGKIDLENNEKQNIILSNQLIQKQKNGIFDTDGMLRYNSDVNQIIYTYYYRNQFIIADTELNLGYRGHTIDTVKNAVIKIASTHSGKVNTLAEKPLIVNNQSFSSGNYLFIKSDRLGKYEPEEMLKDTSIIDVYNLQNQTYEFSFYLYDYAGEKIKNFYIYKNLLIGLSEHHIVLYRLQPLYFDFTY
jgi:uncharacterized membrane protein YphA (DoxX/SURF4 family)